VIVHTTVHRKKFPSSVPITPEQLRDSRRASSRKHFKSTTNDWANEHNIIGRIPKPPFPTSEPPRPIARPRQWHQQPPSRSAISGTPSQAPSDHNQRSSNAHLSSAHHPHKLSSAAHPSADPSHTLPSTKQHTTKSSAAHDRNSARANRGLPR
jgi:hypothetical protein